MFSRDKPYPEMNPLQIATLVGRDKLKPIPHNDWPIVIQNLIEDCCKFKPEERIQSFSEVLKRLENEETISSSTLLDTISPQSHSTSQEDSSSKKSIRIEPNYDTIDQQSNSKGVTSPNETNYIIV